MKFLDRIHENHISTTRNPPMSDALYGQALMIITLSINSINMPKTMQVGVVLYAVCCGTWVLSAGCWVLGAGCCPLWHVSSGCVAPCNQPSYLRQPPAPCRITHLDSVHRSHSTQPQRPDPTHKHGHPGTVTLSQLVWVTRHSIGCAVQL